MSKSSGGPKTSRGKAIVAQNAIVHGIRSDFPVLPGWETADEWEAHRDGLVRSLAPVGDLERALAQRAALLLWRLRRVARYENEMALLGQERVVEDVAAGQRSGSSEPVGSRMEKTEKKEKAEAQPRRDPHDVRRSLDRLRRRYTLVERLPSIPDDAPLPAKDAAAIVEAIANESVAVDPDALTVPGIPDDVPFDEFAGWTAGLVRRVIALIAAESRRQAGGEFLAPDWRPGDDVPLPQQPDDFIPAALSSLRNSVEKAAAELRRAEADLRREEVEAERLRRERLLPAAPVLDRVTRYEAHLSCQLYAALHELEALQSRRQGHPAPLARLEINSPSPLVGEGAGG
ncbi:MAG: hypothetical protein HY332_24710 [Chloroflexi bacterium]|nr:hypothetical protein [Chloroflexota bacterium]